MDAETLDAAVLDGEMYRPVSPRVTYTVLLSASVVLWTGFMTRALLTESELRSQIEMTVNPVAGAAAAACAISTIFAAVALIAALLSKSRAVYMVCADALLLACMAYVFGCEYVFVVDADVANDLAFNLFVPLAPFALVGVMLARALSIRTDM